MLSFSSKKTAFHSGVSLHFRVMNKRYGFSRYPLMKRHISSRLFTKLDNFLPFVFYMVGNKKLCFLLILSKENQIFQSLNHIEVNLKLCGFTQFYQTQSPYRLIYPRPTVQISVCHKTVSRMPLKTTVIGAWPKPEYLKLGDWFQSGQSK